MKYSIHTDIATIDAWCPKASVDTREGWKIGIGPRRRQGGQLDERQPPEHLSGARRQDWLDGYDAGRRYKHCAMVKTVQFKAKRYDGVDVVVSLKGWTAKHGTIQRRLRAQGCSGQVTASYFEGGELKRTVKCLI